MLWVGVAMSKTSNEALFAGYDQIWKTGPEVKHKYTRFFWTE